MTDDAMALLQEVETRMRRAIDTRDRAHRLAATLRGTATRLRMGYDPEDELRALTKRGIRLDESGPVMVRARALLAQLGEETA